MDIRSIATEILETVIAKDAAYGSSCARTAEMLKSLYPNGVKPEDYLHLGLIVRMLDKMGRIANGHLEDSYEDLAGYSTQGALLSRVHNNSSVQSSTCPVCANYE